MKMVNTPGKALFLKNTGHVINCERPAYLAQHMVEFLDDADPASEPTDAPEEAASE